MKKTAFVIFLSLLSIHVFGAGGVDGKIKAISVRETGNIEITLYSAHANPDGCTMSNKVLLDNDHLGKSEIVSILLSSMALGKSTNYWVHGCVSAYGKTYPILVTTTMIN